MARNERRARRTTPCEADYAVCLFFAGCRIPEHHADNPLWRNMVSAFNNAPHGYVAPRRKYVGGAGLKQCRTSIEKGLQPIAARDGVTVSSDLMTDRCGRPQANVMLVNDSGAVFVEAIDCNMESKTGGYIASLLRPIIEKVGPENVVALCMDGGSNYGAANKELMADWPHIEYVPCATHVLDLLMEDVGKITWCKDIVDLCGDMITYVRNHHFTRNYLRSKKVKKGKGKQLVKPVGTRFGTNYIALSRLVELRSTLSQMVLNEEFANWSAGARKQTADTFRGQIMDDAWWKNATYLAELLAIPFKVMRATDSSAKGMMGTIYDLMLQLTEDVNDKLEAGEKILPRQLRLTLGRFCGKRGMGVEVQMRGDGQRPDEKLRGDGRRPDEKLRGDGRRPDEKLRGDGRRPDEKLRGDGRRPDEELRGDGRRPDEKLRGDGRRPDEKR
ncbi:unnamed protein product [Closterium sp. NIES-65]|nr:unnamed protein product [Closterium sp. NIES-65]